MFNKIRKTFFVRACGTVYSTQMGQISMRKLNRLNLDSNLTVPQFEASMEFDLITRLLALTKRLVSNTTIVMILISSYKLLYIGKQRTSRWRYRNIHALYSLVWYICEIIFSRDKKRVSELRNVRHTSPYDDYLTGISVSLVYGNHIHKNMWLNRECR